MGIAIGQVEAGRSAKAGFDLATNSHEQTVPFQVYRRTQFDSPDSGFITDHATEVAGVMIATGTPFALVEGVAPQANLHSGAVVSGIDQDAEIALAMQHVATRNGDDVRALNHSAGRPLLGFDTTDGNAFLTQFVDWSATRHDVLYVAAGFQDTGIIAPLPSDNFNGVTVAASQPFNGGTPADQVYRQVAPFNDFTFDAIGNRTSVDIIAPGFEIRTTSRSDEPLVDGTSYAAPHVTGTVVLLQQFAEQQVTASNPRFIGGNYLHHQVMKAVLLNSADKLAGVMGSNRDVVNVNGNDWLTTSAFSSPVVSLDEQMGAGHLNAKSAVKQFESGEYDPGTVTPRAWDFGQIGSTGSSRDYVFDQPLGPGFFAATLAWDRRVELTNPDNTYNFGDQFFDYVNIDDILTDLDLYLMPAASNNLAEALARSISGSDNVEHIFFNIPAAGNYKIRVQNAGGLGEPEDFGLAWWFGDLPAPVPGDFDDDGDVDNNDLNEWENDFGVDGGSDADGDGDSDGSDFLAWQRNVGATALSASQAVPEPAAWFLMAIGCCFVSCRKQCS